MRVRRRAGSRFRPKWIALGAGAGIVLGATMSDPAMGLVLGAAGGVLIGALARKF